MTEPVAEQRQPTAPLLLARALEHLPSDERQQVMAWLLTRSTGRYSRQEFLHTLAPGPETFREVYGGATSTGSQQVVPVRLPADLHSRLRLWCTEHGFSMATVVRGLVARFLDGQSPAADAEAPPVA